MSSHSQVFLLLFLCILYFQGRVVKTQPAKKAELNMDIFKEFNNLFGHDWWVNGTVDSEQKQVIVGQEDDLEALVKDILHLTESTKQLANHKLCIIVPFRDRFEELLEFAPYMKKFLDNQAVKNEVWVINQVDKFRFNRASLINVGFHESSPSCDYIAIHDVDLLPQNPNLLYKYPEKGPHHLSPPGLHPEYSYPTFMGGILLISREHYQELDGMSNKYWGWGLEDDEFYLRMREAGMAIGRPAGIRTGSKGTFLHNHSKERKRDYAKCYNQEIFFPRQSDRQTGLSTTVYYVKRKRQLVVDRAPVNFLDIHLECDKSVTPWCNCP